MSKIAAEPPQHWKKTVINGIPCLVPAEEWTDEWLSKVKVGTTIALSIGHIRNAARSALYWVVCGLVAKNHPELNHREKVSDTLKQLAGLVSVWSVTLPGGEKVYWAKPKSIAFANMTEDRFQEFMESAFRLIETELWPGVDLEALRQEANARAGADVSARQSRGR